MIGRDRPSLADLRARVQKERYREIGNWPARRLARPSAVYGTWLAVRLGATAHQVTLAALSVSIGSALAIGTGTHVGFVSGVGLGILAFWLDHVDGQVARWNGSSSLDGVYFDYILHHVTALTLGFALGFGLAARSGDIRWTVAGCAIALGWMFLSLHNDCRYKAMFQRLKREQGSFRVDGGAGGRPAPPSGWPRSGRGIVTWPLYKGCEPHVVLIGLILLSIVSFASQPVWLLLWRTGVIGMAVLAPTLAFGRIGRTIVRGDVDAEFTRWFQGL